MSLAMPNPLSLPRAVGTRLRRPAESRAEPVVLPPGGKVVTARSADGTRIRAQVYGPDEAPTIVLAHGITNQMKAWAYQVHDLQDRFRVVVYDQRGHGLSGRPVELAKFSVNALGDDLQAVLEATVPEGQKAVIAGHSLGGITIMAWARRYPREVEKRAAAAVLVNTAAGSILDHIALVGIPKPVHGAGRALVRQRLLQIARTGAKGPLRWIAIGQSSDPVWINALASMAQQVPLETLSHFAYHITDMDLSPGLANLTVPTVVVGSQLDRLLPVIHSERMVEALPKLDQYVVLPTAGHMGQWEARETVSELLADVAKRHLVRKRKPGLKSAAAE